MSERRAWVSKAVFLSFWVLSSWYLYIGGISMQTYTFPETFTGILIANALFAVIFMLYAGVGKGKDQLFQEAFGGACARYGISILPSLCQIGWTAVLIEVGGSALASLLQVEVGSGGYYGILTLYGVLLIFLAQGGTKRIVHLAKVTVPAIVFFLIWVGYTITDNVGLSEIVDYQPTPASPSVSRLAGVVNLFLAAFISAALVIPDVLSDLRSRRDVLAAAWVGLVPPTLLVGSVGAMLFMVSHSFDVVATLKVMSGPLFVYLLLSIDNLCGAAALFPVGLGFASCKKEATDDERDRLRVRFTQVGGVVAIGCACIGIVGVLPLWLQVLGGVLAPIIGIVIANQYIVRENYREVALHWPALVAWAMGIIASWLPSVAPVLVSMVIGGLAFVVVTRFVPEPSLQK